jgi:hypothetical protein
VPILKMSVRSASAACPLCGGQPAICAGFWLMKLIPIKLECYAGAKADECRRPKRTTASGPKAWGASGML